VVPAAVAPSSAITLSGFEQDMYYSHLATRQQNAVGGLVLDPTLTAVARQRAYDMASNGYFSHYAPGDNSGRATVFRLLAGAGVTYTIAGENIARNNMADSISVSTAMNAFMNSAGHRSTLLDSRYHRVGVGAAVSPTGMKYYAVVFAS
jgi:uncharacterized protein YkwD